MSAPQHEAEANAPPAMIRVWDPFVRVFHWALVAAFAIAYVSAEGVEFIHVWAGYLVGALVAMRVVWGVVGPRRARFADFVYAPSRVWEYMRDMLRLRSARYIGHSPAGGAMVIAMLLALSATVWSGMETYAIREGRGPLASATIISPAAAVEQARADDGEEGRGGAKGGGLWKAAHEALSSLMLVLIVLHLVGVALASLAHRENLPRSMITGLKRPE